MNVYDIRTGKLRLLSLRLSELIPADVKLDRGLYTELDEMLSCGDAFTAFVAVGWALRWADALRYSQAQALKVWKETCTDVNRACSEQIEYELDAYLDSVRTVDKLRKKGTYNLHVECSLCLRRDDLESLAYAFPSIRNTLYFADAEQKAVLGPLEVPKVGLFLRLDLTRKYQPHCWWAQSL